MAEAVDLTKTIITDLPTELEVQKSMGVYSDKPAALAIVLGVTVESVMNICPHDGGDLVDDKAVDITRFQGFTVQEIVDICLLQGFSVTEVDLDLGDNPPKNYFRETATNHYRKIVAWEEFEQNLLNSRGFVTYYFFSEVTAPERTLAYLGNGTKATLIDPVSEVQWSYPRDPQNLAIQLVSLIRIDK